MNRPVTATVAKAKDLTKKRGRGNEFSWTSRATGKANMRACARLFATAHAPVRGKQGRADEDWREAHSRNTFNQRCKFTLLSDTCPSLYEHVLLNFHLWLVDLVWMASGWYVSRRTSSWDSDRRNAWGGVPGAKVVWVVPTISHRWRKRDADNTVNNSTAAFSSQFHHQQECACELCLDQLCPTHGPYAAQLKVSCGPVKVFAVAKVS